MYIVPSGPPNFSYIFLQPVRFPGTGKPPQMLKGGMANLEFAIIFCIFVVETKQAREQTGPASFFMCLNREQLPRT